jgi:hypothetical protein
MVRMMETGRWDAAHVLDRAADNILCHDTPVHKARSGKMHGPAHVCVWFDGPKAQLFQPVFSKNHKNENKKKL